MSSQENDQTRLASTSKTNWKRSGVGDMSATKPLNDENHSGGDSPNRSVEKRRSSQSTTHQSNATSGTSRSSPSPTIRNRTERREKQSNTTDSPRTYPKQGRSKSTSPEGQRGNARDSPHRKSPDLPPYIRATIAEQLTPAGTRRAREDTKDNLFGQDDYPKQKSSNARCRENTQKNLFGAPDPPLAARKSSRHLADTKHNLFGPPPEVPHRLKSRNLADTPDILSHELRPQSDLRETQLHTIVGRYVLRYQNTHQKLFGAPEPLRKPPPKLASNIFHDEPVTNQNQAVKSLPLSNLIVTRDAPMPSPQEISPN